MLEKQSRGYGNLLWIHVLVELKLDLVNPELRINKVDHIIKSCQNQHPLLGKKLETGNLSGHILLIFVILSQNGLKVEFEDEIR